MRPWYKGLLSGLVLLTVGLTFSSGGEIYLLLASICVGLAVYNWSGGLPVKTNPKVKGGILKGTAIHVTEPPSAVVHDPSPPPDPMALLTLAERQWIDRIRSGRR